MRITYISLTTTLFYFWTFLFSTVDAKESTMGHDSISTTGRGATCPDGSPAVVTYLQRYRREPFQPDIYTTDCPSSAGGSNVIQAASLPEEALSIQTLHRRHDNACPINCAAATTCTAGSNGPTVSDCNQLSSYLSSRGQSQVVQVKQTVTATFGSCITRFTNNVDISVTWCDSQWADQVTKLVGSCLPQSTSARCSASNIAIEVVRDPAATTTTTSTRPTTTSSPTSTTTSTTTTTTTSTSTSSTSLLTATSNTTRTNTTVSGSLHSTTLSITSQISSANSSVEVPLPQGESQNANTASSGHDGKPGVSIGAVIGGVIGIILLLLLLIVTGWWLWRKRKRRVEKGMIPLVDEPINKLQGPLLAFNSNTRRGSQLTDAEELSPTIIIGRKSSDWDNSEKLALASESRRRQPTLTTSGSSFVQLLSPGVFGSGTLDGLESSQADSTSAYNDPHSYTEQTSGQSRLNTAYGSIGGEAQLLRSVSARALARALAPNSSEDEVNRLAENIAQVAAITSPDGQIQIVHRGSTPGLSDIRSEAGTTGGTEDPPPPWRESWNSNNRAR